MWSLAQKGHGALLVPPPTLLPLEALGSAGVCPEGRQAEAYGRGRDTHQVPGRMRWAHFPRAARNRSLERSDSQGSAVGEGTAYFEPSPDTPQLTDPEQGTSPPSQNLPKGVITPGRTPGDKASKQLWELGTLGPGPFLPLRLFRLRLYKDQSQFIRCLSPSLSPVDFTSSEGPCGPGLRTSHLPHPLGLQATTCLCSGGLSHSSSASFPSAQKSLPYQKAHTQIK